ncbi:type 1 glutamine amidotransferase domain-containing protein [Rheinheimera sp.]|uniref:type 1 glutamine amidotransferase domain-containing protein n=1 Tax=Rheinheimera sp. TaxID=1869214 RepID=UPI003AF95380
MKIVITAAATALLGLSSVAAQAADKVLIVVTSHSQMGNTAEQTGYWLSEVTHPYKVLTDAGFSVDIASLAGGKAPADPRSLDSKDSVNQWFAENAVHQQKLEQSLKLSALKPEEYDAVIFAGGHGTMWDFPSDQVLQQFAAALYERQGVVAAVCHGPAALLNIRLSSGDLLIKGKKLTGFSNEEEQAVKLDQVVPFSLQDELTSRGGLYSAAGLWQSNVVVDQRLVTGQNPQSAEEVGHAVSRLLRAAALSSN